MWTCLLIFLFFSNVWAEGDDFRLVKLDSGLVRGDKFWNGDYYEFYGIPYAKMPTGRDRFKGPEPVEPWDDVLFASNNNKLCHQCYYTEESEDDVILAGEDECLTMNVLVPKSTKEGTLVPVVVYIHSGAFSGGSGNMAKFGYLARHDIIVVSFNYRVGAYGFACLGNEEIPGNAGLKDQVAALRWIKKNIESFGGDPNKITLAGFSVGAAMAELLVLSKAVDGIVNQLVLESGSALSPFTINRDPVSTAWNIALSAGYNGTANLDELTDFYLNADTKILAIKSLNYFLPNSTFGFAPCIEKVQDGVEAVVTESPLDILKRGDYPKIPVLTGFSNMEGLSRSIKFGPWREGMNENFADFLPADLKFPSEKEQQEVISQIKQRYFDNKNVTAQSLSKYVDYFSDSMFKYGIMKSAKIHAAVSQKPVYLYEFSYVGKLNIQHNYMDRIVGASHRDQTAYLLDFFGFTNNYRDLDTRERMTTMWTDYVQYGNPTQFESHIITVRWPTYTKESDKYLEISKRLQVKQGLFDEEYKFWDKIYEKYYWNPTTVVPQLNVPIPEKIPVKSKKPVVKKLPEATKPVIKEDIKDKQSADPKVTTADPPKNTETLNKVVETKPTVENKENIKPEPKQKEEIKTKQNVDNKQTSGAKISETKTNNAKKDQKVEDVKTKPTLKRTTTITTRGDDGKLHKKVITNDKDSEQIDKEIKKDENKKVQENIPNLKVTETDPKAKINQNQKEKPTERKESAENKENPTLKKTTADKTVSKDKKIKTNVINADTVQVEDPSVKEERITLTNTQGDKKREEETVKIKNILAAHEEKEKQSK